jgi:hypothetical protein
MVVGKMTKLALSLGMLALATAGTALADGPQTEAGVEGTATGALHSAKTGSTLPFTGTNLAIFIAVAIGLGLIGFAMRRAGRSQA